MFTLTVQDVLLNQHFATKQDAITYLADCLIKAGVVNAGYGASMLEREAQNATYLGNGIAIPHGTTDKRDAVLQTGIKVVQIPEGVVWGESGEVAYLVIAVAANSTEHLALLKRLVGLLDNDTLLPTLRFCTEPKEITALLNEAQPTKKMQPLTFNAKNIMRDMQGDTPQDLASLLSLGFLQQGHVQPHFTESLSFDPCLHLGQEIWLVASCIGVNQPTFGIVSAKEPFEFKRRTLHTLIVIATQDDAHLVLLKQLAGLVYRDELAQLKSNTSEAVAALLFGKPLAAKTIQMPSDAHLEKTCTIMNTHGLHTRPASVLVKIAKGFKAKIEIASAQAPERFVSAQSLMKVISLGVGPSEQVLLRAQGEDAAQALETLSDSIDAGLK